jgi:hypothetical protein
MKALAACHVHSKWSYDGSWTLEALSAKFQRNGYRVLMMTEHDRGFSRPRWNEYRATCAQITTPDFLVVPGIEYSDAENRVHVLAWGDLPFLGESLPTNEMLQKVSGLGGIAVFAHPTRKEAWKTYQRSWAKLLLGIEIWNRKYDGWAPSRTAPDLLSDSKAVPFVGLDFHTIRQSFPLGMELEIHGAITEEAVLDAMRARRCNATAFNRSFAQSTVRNALPILRMAERGRRTGASIVRSARRLVK